MIKDKIKDYIVHIAREVFHVEALSRYEERIVHVEELFFSMDKVIDGIHNRMKSLEGLCGRLDASVLSLNNQKLVDLIDSRIPKVEIPEHKCGFQESVNNLKKEIQSELIKIDSNLDNRLASLEFFRKNYEDNKVTLSDLVDSKLSIFESNINDKIIGLWKSIDERFYTNGNGKAIPGLMKRIAQLEGIKDAIEHRRSSQEIMERRNMLRNIIVTITNNIDLKVIEARLADLDWVLGESK